MSVRSRARPDVTAKPAVREPVREEAVPTDRAVFIGRDGKPVWRKGRSGGDDKFHVPDEVRAKLAAAGYEPEWKRYTIFGADDKTYQAELHRQGWEAVLAEEFDGVFMPSGHKGPVVVDGLMLMARGAVLCEESRHEDKARADGQVRSAKQERGFLPADSSMDPNHPAARARTFVKVSRDVTANADEFRPKHQLAID